MLYKCIYKLDVSISIEVVGSSSNVFLTSSFNSEIMLILDDCWAEMERDEHVSSFLNPLSQYVMDYSNA